MIAAAGQAILHATVAALLVEALLRLWRVEDPGERLAMRWVAMAAPTLRHDALPPARAVARLAVVRRALGPVRRRALERTSAWAASAPPRPPAPRSRCSASRLPARRRAVSRRPPGPRPRREAGCRPATPPARASAMRIAALDAPGGHRLADVTVLALETPVLLCTGVDRTAHHRLHRHARLGSTTRALEAAAGARNRAPGAPRPAGGLVADGRAHAAVLQPGRPDRGRQAVEDMERRADIAVAAQGRADGWPRRFTGCRPPRTFTRTWRCPPKARHPADRVLASAHRRALDDRCERLLEARVPAVLRTGPWRLGLAGAAVAGAPVLRGVAR